MTFDENPQVKKTFSSSKIVRYYYPFHIILTLLDSIHFDQQPFYALNSHNNRMGEQAYLNSRHAVAKIVSMLCGCFVTFFSYFAYSDSIWHTEGYWLQCEIARAQNKPYIVWTWPPNTTILANSTTYMMETHVCPSITHERFLVYSSASMLVMSIIGFLSCCVADLETVSAIRKREAFYCLFSGCILIIGGILFMVSPARIQSGNQCWIVDKDGRLVKSNWCSSVFIHESKFIAGALGVVGGIINIALACVLENTKLYGIDTRSRHAHSDDQEELYHRHSISRTKKPSNGNNAKVKKGVGSFGAVTSNIGHHKSTHTNKIRASSEKNPTVPGVTVSAPQAGKLSTSS